MSTLNLNKKEYKYIRVTVKKLWKNRGKKLSVREPVLKKLQDQFVTNFSERAIPIDRNGLRILQKLVTLALLTLNKDVIPGYEKRAIEDPKKYKPYLKRAEGAVPVLEGLLAKLEVEL